jgi:glutathione S-transferase
MHLELFFAPGACSFVPHSGLEAIKAATGQDFAPKLVKLHKGEHKTPEYLQMNPDGQVPVLRADGRPLTQIVAIADFLDRSFPNAGLLPSDPWKRSVALSQLAWMNSTPHTTFTRVFFPERFAESDAGKAEVKRKAAEAFRGYLARLDQRLKELRFGVLQDAYAFTLLRWGGYAGIDPASFPELKSHVESAMKGAPLAAALERERTKLDTYKAAA